MKLVSHQGNRVSPAAAPPKRPRPPLTRWIRARSGLGRALFVKALFALLVAAVAVYAVHLLAHVVQAAEQNINR